MHPYVLHMYVHVLPDKIRSCEIFCLSMVLTHLRRSWKNWMLTGLILSAFSAILSSDLSKVWVRWRFLPSAAKIWLSSIKIWVSPILASIFLVKNPEILSLTEKLSGLSKILKWEAQNRKKTCMQVPRPFAQFFRRFLGRCKQIHTCQNSERKILAVFDWNID